MRAAEAAEIAAKAAEDAAEAAKPEEERIVGRGSGLPIDEMLKFLEWT